MCKNDIIVVDVQNNMGGTSTAIHWHGLHQRDTPFMDGVPFVTQCPIEFSTTFRYMMRATEAGTHFYHSHAGKVYTGVYGDYMEIVVLYDILGCIENKHFFFGKSKNMMLWDCCKKNKF